MLIKLNTIYIWDNYCCSVIDSYTGATYKIWQKLTINNSAIVLCIIIIYGWICKYNKCDGLFYILRDSDNSMQIPIVRYILACTYIHGWEQSLTFKRVMFSFPFFMIR